MIPLLKAWRNDKCDSRIPLSQRQIAVKDNKIGNDNCSSVSPTLATPWGPLGPWERWSTCRQSGDLVPAVNRSFVPTIYWYCWLGPQVFILEPRQRIKVNQYWQGSLSHQGSHGQQLCRPERHPSGLWSVFFSDRFPSWPRSSMRFSESITFANCGNTIEGSLSLNLGKTQYFPLPIDPLVSSTRLVNCLRRSN